MSHEIPPRAVAELDQYFAEANDKYAELVELLRKMTADRGEYGALAEMARSLDIASKETLISMVVTGMSRDMKHGNKDKDA